MAWKRNYILLFFLLFPFEGIFSQEYTLPAFIDDMTSCDIDQDGDEDVLCICQIFNYSEDSIFIFYNDGDGTFQRTSYFSPNVNFISCDCLNEDVFPDILTRHSQNIYYIPNYGLGGFGDTVNVAEMSGTLNISEISDINNDNWNDFIYSNTSYEYWGILKNIDGHIFTNEVLQSGSSTTLPSVGLLNNDSLPDVVLSYSTFDRTSVFLNNGSLSFTEIVLEDNFNYATPVMNLDNQNTEDFALVNFATNKIALYKYIGIDGFELQSNYYATGTYGIAYFLAGDFNQDMYDDFAIVRCNWYDCTDSLYIYLNDKNWSFKFHQSIYIGQMGYFKACSSDLNGDSYPDIFMKGCNGDNLLTLLWNDGFGSFSFENPVGVIDNQLNSIQINVSPNPFSDQIEIKLTAFKPTNLQIIITNMFGQNIRLIKSSNSDKTEHLLYQWDGCDIFGNSCPPGVYFITVIFNSKKITKKVVKL